MESPLIKYLPANQIGLDYVCGDLHGHKQLLMEKLAELGFDFGKDRLFCTGDLNDRGPDSFGTLMLMYEPWFHFVKGNHEADLPDFVAFEYSKFPGWKPSYCDQEWLYSLSPEQIDQLKTVCLPALANAPMALRVEGERGFWMVHADRGVWGGYFNPIPLLTDDNLPHANGDRQLESLLWSRRLFNQIPHLLEDQGKFLSAPGSEIAQGVGLTFVGHSVVERPTLFRSHFFLDTGAYMPDGYLTVLRVRDLMDKLPLPSGSPINN